MNYSPTYISDLIAIQQAIPNLDKLRNSNILITGATGLVCSAIVDFLLFLNDTNSMGLTIFVAARNKEKAEHRFGELINRADVVFVKYDALQALSWDFDLDFIIHGASPANPFLYTQKPVETMLANIIGINNILDYAKERDVKRVLFVSSSEVYGKKENNKPYGEEEYGYVDILNARACYPSAKRASETLCISYCEEYGVNGVIVRLGHIYGPTANREDTRASTQFFYDVIDGHDIVMKSAGLQMRSYCYMADCVSAIIAVLLNGENKKSYNISNPESIVSIRELADKIATASGRQVVYEKPSDSEVKGFNLMPNSSLSSARITELGWTGLYNLEDGVAHTLSILKGE